jgi:hypothetical protein
MSHMLKWATLPDLSQAPCRPRPHFCEHSGSSAIIRTLCLQMSHFGSYKSIAFFQIIVVRSNSAHRICTLRLILTRAFVACLASEWQSRQRQMFLLSSSSRPLSRTALRFCKGTGLFCTSPRKSRNQDHQSVRLVMMDRTVLSAFTFWWRWHNQPPFGTLLRGGSQQPRCTPWGEHFSSSHTKRVFSSFCHLRHFKHSHS